MSGIANSIEDADSAVVNSVVPSIREQGFSKDCEVSSVALVAIVSNTMQFYR